MSGRTAIIVQARMRSSRLPGKVLLEVGGRPILDVMAERLARVRLADLVVIATTTDAVDDAIHERARDLGLLCVRGPEDDVLARYAQAAEAADAAVIVRITADCPLIDPSEIDRLLAEFAEAHGALDYLRNQAGETRSIPRGFDVEVFTREALGRANTESREQVDREHVTPYLYRQAGRFRTRVSEPGGRDLSHLRLTVDTPADLDVIDRIITAVGSSASTADIVAFLDAHPDVAELNSAVHQKSLDTDENRRRLAIDGRLLIGRADASAEMGSGHVARLMSLLGGWVNHGGRATLYSQPLQPFWVARLRAAGIDSAPAPATLGELAVTATALDAVAVCVDGYAFLDDEILTLNGVLPVVRIDDFAGGAARSADVVVDPNLGAVARGEASGGKRLLAGASFALLRAEFETQPPWAAGADARVLVTFGSSDPARVTIRCVESLLQARPPGFEIAVIAGPSMDEGDVAALVHLADEGQIKLLRDVEDMPSALRSARVGITAAGTTILEFLALGSVPLSVQVADNQVVSGGGLSASGLGFDLGAHGDVDFDALAEQAFALLANPGALGDLSRSGMATVDRRGVQRILDAALDAIEGRRAQRPRRDPQA